MTPNETFFYRSGYNNFYDNQSLIQFYLPILGIDAVGLYAYFNAFWDNGKQTYRFTEILNHMQFGMARFEEALALLTAMDLVVFYQTSEGYLIDLKPSLSRTEFLSNPAYRRLLEKRIGEVAVKRLMVTEPENTRNLSKKFSDVFSNVGEADTKRISKSSFDWESFQKRMKADGLNLVNENDDIITLYSLAERHQLTWFDLYQMAKETAYHGSIRPQRIAAKLTNKQIGLPLEDFSAQEKILLEKSKGTDPKMLLAEIKKGRRATTTSNELKLIDELVAMNFLDEVINIMIIYTMAKTKSANLNKTYLMKIANDFAYQEVKNAEVAISKMRSFEQRKVDTKKNTKPVKSNVPEWSNPDYKNETTPEEKTELEEIKRQMLARLGGNE